MFSVASEPLERMFACTAAPRATTSSGLSSVWGFLPRALSAEELIGERADRGNAGRAADEDDLIDLVGSDSGVLQCLFAGSGGAIEHGLDERFELRALDLALIFCAAWKFDVEKGGIFRRQRDLRLDDRFANGLDGFGIGAKIDALVALNIVEGNGDEQVVDVVAAEVGVAVGGHHLEDPLMQLEDGDIESTAAKVVDRDDSVVLAVEAVGERSRGGLVDQAQDFEAGDAARIFGGLALRVVEVGGDSDHRFADRRTEVAFGVALELAKDEGGNFRRRVFALANAKAQYLARLDVFGEMEGEELQLLLHVFEAAPHEALRGVDDAIGRGREILRCSIANNDSLAAGCRITGWTGIATTDGTRAEPSSPGMTTGCSPCMNATSELVVPKSIPITRSSAIAILVCIST